MSNALIHTAKVEGFTVHTYACVEDLNPADDFADDQETLDGIESGELVWFRVEVIAVKAGVELGADHLGACCYKSYEDFANEDGYHADMIKNAVAEAKKTIAELCAA